MTFVSKLYFSPVKSLSFQHILKCEVIKNIGIKNDRVIAFSRNVDIESSLHNSFHPLQKCVQGKYIPGSKSDMYDSRYLIPTTNKVKMTNNLLFNKESFNSFNPNKCNLGHKIFNNHIRQQTKNTDYFKKPIVEKKEKK